MKNNIFPPLELKTSRQINKTSLYTFQLLQEKKNVQDKTKDNFWQRTQAPGGMAPWFYVLNNLKDVVFLNIAIKLSKDRPPSRPYYAVTVGERYQETFNNLFREPEKERCFPPPIYVRGMRGGSTPRSHTRTNRAPVCAAMLSTAKAANAALRSEKKRITSECAIVAVWAKLSRMFPHRNLRKSIAEIDRKF